jgi:hypothetical protein
MVSDKRQTNIAIVEQKHIHPTGATRPVPPDRWGGKLTVVRIVDFL